MKKSLSLVAIYSVFILIFVSCKDLNATAKESGISCDPNELIFPMTGGEEIISLKSGADWSATTYEDWVIVSPSSGKGNTPVTIKCLNGYIDETEILFSSAYGRVYVIIKRESSKVQIQAIDLGLPSGIKWANMNVGASAPEVYGSHYSWGDVGPAYSDLRFYKFCNNGTFLTKYCTDSYYGKVDNKMVLEPEDDAAYMKWGGNWRIPTIEEFIELRANCNWSYTTNYMGTGVKGAIVSSKLNNNSIFMPAAGHYEGSNFIRDGSGSYWSSSLYELYPFHALAFDIMYGCNTEFDRSWGLSIRPVCK